jgi:predicted nucleotidyltransferase
MTGRAGAPRAQLVGVAQRIVDRLVAEGLPDLRAAYLFGSAVWGDADAASDLDIMLLQDRPVGYRAVRRVRVADALGLQAPLPAGPRYADLAYHSAVGFAETLGKGLWGDRVRRAVILKDTGGFLERLCAETVAALTTPQAYAMRFARKREQAQAERAGMWRALAAGEAGTGRDDALAVLHGRLAVQEAAGALLDLNDDRVSITHFVDGVGRALAAFGRGDLFAPFVEALDLRPGEEGVRRSLSTLELFTGRLRQWLREPALRAALSEEDLAWSEFTCGEETREEIAHKVEVLGAQPGRLPALQFYLDGCIHVHVGLQFGRMLRLRLRGDAVRVRLAEAHALLREYADEERAVGGPLLGAWIDSLRLGGSAGSSREIDALSTVLLEVGEQALQTVGRSA